MPTVSLTAIVHHCDRILRTNEIGDYAGAANGLQVENRGQISRIAAAVDASPTTVAAAMQSAIIAPRILVLLESLVFIGSVSHRADPSPARPRHLQARRSHGSRRPVAAVASR